MRSKGWSNTQDVRLGRLDGVTVRTTAPSSENVSEPFVQSTR
jgi:hypothetical protein